MNYDVTVWACPNCGAEEHQSVEKARPFRYTKCDQCGLIYMNPRPSQWEIDEFYANDYLDSRPGANSIDILIKDEAGRARRIIKEIQGGRTFLDIGCASGALLREAIHRGFNVLGVEANIDHVEKGLPAVKSLDDVDRTFDVIACIHTLEHVIDFKGLADWIKAHIAEGGQVIIEVPSRQSKGHFNDCHLYLFSLPILVDLFKPLAMVKGKLTPHQFIMFEEGKNA